jgi:hypothetical protein
MFQTVVSNFLSFIKDNFFNIAVFEENDRKVKNDEGSPKTVTVKRLVFQPLVVLWEPFLFISNRNVA